MFTATCSEVTTTSSPRLLSCSRTSLLQTNERAPEGSGCRGGYNPGSHVKGGGGGGCGAGKEHDKDKEKKSGAGSSGVHQVITVPELDQY